MNTPNPLMPQGSLQPSKGKSTVRIAVFTIVAIHAVFFAGLLMQGCKRDADSKGKGTEQTNASNELPKMMDATNTGSYYTNAAELPPVTTNLAANRSAAGTDLTQPLSQSNTQQVTYQPPGPMSAVAPSPVETPKGESKEYTVVRGDSLYKIAKAHGVSIGDITKLNPDLDPKALKPGQKIQVPQGGTSAAPATGHASGAGEATATESAGSSSNYVIKAGDTLAKVARQHGVSLKALRAANHLKTDRLMVGQKLKIPAGEGTKAAAANQATGTVDHTGQSGTISTNR